VAKDEDNHVPKVVSDTLLPGYAGNYRPDLPCLHRTLDGLVSDLRTRLAEALAEFFDRNNITVGTAHPALAAEALLSLPGIAITEGLQKERANLCGNDEYAPLHVRWVSEWERVGPKGDHSCPHAAAAAQAQEEQ
jgi:hypothetical protein